MFVCVCPRLLGFAYVCLRIHRCLRLSTFARICLRLPLCRAISVGLWKEGTTGKRCWPGVVCIKFSCGIDGPRKTDKACVTSVHWIPYLRAQRTRTRLATDLVPNLKGPSRTKNTTESKFRYREKIRYGGSKTLRRGRRNACFSGKKRREPVQKVKN